MWVDFNAENRILELLARLPQHINCEKASVVSFQNEATLCLVVFGSEHKKGFAKHKWLWKTLHVAGTVAKKSVGLKVWWKRWLGHEYMFSPLKYLYFMNSPQVDKNEAVFRSQTGRLEYLILCFDKNHNSLNAMI